MTTPCRFTSDPTHTCHDRDGRTPPRDTCFMEAAAQLSDEHHVAAFRAGLDDIDLAVALGTAASFARPSGEPEQGGGTATAPLSDVVQTEAEARIAEDLETECRGCGVVDPDVVWQRDGLCRECAAEHAALRHTGL